MQIPGMLRGMTQKSLVMVMPLKTIHT